MVMWLVSIKERRQVERQAQLLIDVYGRRAPVEARRRATVAHSMDDPIQERLWRIARRVEKKLRLADRAFTPRG